MVSATTIRGGRLNTILYVCIQFTPKLLISWSWWIARTNMALTKGSPSNNFWNPVTCSISRYELLGIAYIYSYMPGSSKNTAKSVGESALKRFNVNIIQNDLLRSIYGTCGFTSVCYHVLHFVAMTLICYVYSYLWFRSISCRCGTVQSWTCFVKVRLQSRTKRPSQKRMWQHINIHFWKV